MLCVSEENIKLSQRQTLEGVVSIHTLMQEVILIAQESENDHHSPEVALCSGPPDL